MAVTQLKLSEQTDLYRIDADRKIPQAHRANLGQFMTSAPIALYMASLFGEAEGNITLLEPGAGVGSLISAFVDEMGDRENRPGKISVDAWEIDEELLGYLKTSLVSCATAARDAGIDFDSQIFQMDFIEHAVDELREQKSMFSVTPVRRYTHCIMNPPYRKISSVSQHRLWLREVGIETSNLYTAFLSLAVKLLEPGGEMVAIIPRSFCNGPYFKGFRRFFLSEMSIRYLHVFSSRDRTFKDNAVLQENIILFACKGEPKSDVMITSSNDADMHDLSYQKVEYNQVVDPADSAMVIKIIANGMDQVVAERIKQLPESLASIGIEVSTGPVVDFRALDDIVREPKVGAYPLIYPSHFTNGFVEWPKTGRKPNAIHPSQSSEPTLMPGGWYVLTRRFSSKEEKRRLVSAVYSPNRVQGKKVGFENHLNVFHSQGRGLDPLLVKGLALYLNSTLVDLYFRQFSGHTQVNASDLRSLPYPDKQMLIRLGGRVGEQFPNQEEIDHILDSEMPSMPKKTDQNPVLVQTRIQEALELLIALGLPRAQHNERSALTLLALLNLKPEEPWSEAHNLSIGITPIMDFSEKHYGRKYAPNTRETFRRFTMHQFVQAGIAVSNPDLLGRPVNSPKTVYQIEPNALDLIKSFGRKNWMNKLAAYNAVRTSLTKRYAKERTMNKIPLELLGKTLDLTPGPHSELIKAIVEEFGPRFAPGAEALYISDTGAKMLHFEAASFAQLGLVFDAHGKFPDVVLYWRKRNWLLLIEAVTSHGPVNPKRHAELTDLFSKSNAGLVYVTAFPDRQMMARYLGDISWETEVWVAEAPTHMIHFNGERFMGPH
jgi:adenine-specific DNA-methyltransferase